MKTAIKWILGLLAFTLWAVHAVIADREWIGQTAVVLGVIGLMVGFAKVFDREDSL